MKTIISLILVIVLYTFMVIAFFKGQTDLMILDGVSLIIAHNSMLNTKKGE